MITVGRVSSLTVTVATSLTEELPDVTVSVTVLLPTLLQSNEELSIESVPPPKIEPSSKSPG